MSGMIQFTLNGIERKVAVEADLMLIDVIRDEFDLTGTKRGCDNATCGTCTVVVNGKAVKSCNFPIEKAAGAEIMTVEHLAQGMQLHPIQQAIAESGAVQCGFCTPGIVMELYSLLEYKPDASESEITTALNKHLCRCTGYEPIMDGALIAKKLIQERTTTK